MSDPYSASRVTRGITHLLGGKAVTSLAGIGTFILLVRELPVEQFAVYVILFALLELIEAVSGVGLAHVLSRYVPELFSGARIRALRRLLAIGLGLRLGVLLAIVALLYLLVPALAPTLGLQGWEWAVRVYLAVVIARVAAAALFSVLESMLRQGIAQIGFGLVTLLRFALLAAFSVSGGLDLHMVIFIELVTDVVGVAVMLVGLIRTVPRPPPGPPREPDDGPGWLRTHFRRVFAFGAKGYLQHLLIMPFGGATNRLLVGGALPGPEVALFGFAQSVADLMQRYLPVRLLAGVIRPVLTARYVRDRRFADIELASNLIFKVNVVLVCLAAVLVQAGGESLLAALTGGKYSERGVGLLLVMCALVLMYSLRQMLDHVSHAVECNGPLIWSNALISLSLIPGLALLPYLGVYALPVANVVGMAAGCALLVGRLRAEGFDYRQDLRGLTRLLAATALAMVAARAGEWLLPHWAVSMTIGAGAYALSVWLLRPWRPEEGRLAAEMMRALRPASAP